MSKDNEEIRKDNTDDADIENKDSDVDDESDDDADLEDDELSDDDVDPSDKDGADGEDEDDDKPLTRKDLEAILKTKQNKANAGRRVSQKQPISSSHKKVDNDRLNRLEVAQQRQELVERKRQFGHEHNLSPKAVDHVFRLTKRPTGKFLQDPAVKGALDAIRASERTRVNTPGTNGRTVYGDNKTWTDLKPEEKQANFADRRRSILESKKGR
jgi:hypothetical protein